MKIEYMEELINEAIDNKKQRDVAYKYELKLGDFPIRISFGIN